MTTLQFKQVRAGEVSLSGEFTIFEAARVKPLLLDSLDAAPTLRIDLAGVTELDTAGVQLMLMLQREAALVRKPLEWRSHSNAVVQVLDTLNLSGEFDAPAAIVWS